MILTFIIPSVIVYGHNSVGNFFAICPLKLMMWFGENCWPPTRFLSLAIVARYDSTQQHNCTISQASVLSMNFDRITINLGIISICPVALSCYTSPTSSLVPPTLPKFKPTRQICIWSNRLHASPSSPIFLSQEAVFMVSLRQKSNKKNKQLSLRKKEVVANRSGISLRGRRRCNRLHTSCCQSFELSG